MKSQGAVIKTTPIIMGHDQPESVIPIPYLNKILRKQKTDDLIININTLDADEFIKVHEAIEKEIKRRGMNDRL